MQTQHENDDQCGVNVATSQVDFVSGFICVSEWLSHVTNEGRYISMTSVGGTRRHVLAL